MEKIGRPSISWRKSRLAARILIRDSKGRLTVRDRRLAQHLAVDPHVAPYLVDQGVAGLCAPFGYDYHADDVAHGSVAPLA
jgi:hypothetical protein